MMKIAKSVLVFVLTMALVFSLAACGGNGEENPSSGANSAQVSSQAAPESNAASTPVSSGSVTQPSEAEEPSAPEDAQTAAPGGFDENLVGVWYQMEDLTQDNDKVKFSDLFVPHIMFLPDGRFYTNRADGIFFEYSEIAAAQAAGLQPVKASASNGELDLFAPYCDYAKAIAPLGIGEYNDAYFEGIDGFTDIHIAYSFEDIEEHLNETFKDSKKNFYQKYDNDKLTLHITGKYASSPVETFDIDTTLVYVKSYPNFMESYFYEPYFIGNWKDTSGNDWAFSYDEEDNFQFSLTDPAGNVYTNGFIRDEASYYYDKPECKEALSFYFDNFSTPVYYIVSFNNDTLSMENAETGEAFTMTRQISVE